MVSLPMPSVLSLMAALIFARSGVPPNTSKMDFQNKRKIYIRVRSVKCVPEVSSNYLCMRHGILFVPAQFRCGRHHKIHQGRVQFHYTKPISNTLAPNRIEQLTQCLVRRRHVHRIIQGFLNSNIHNRHEIHQFVLCLLRARLLVDISRPSRDG